MDYSPLTSVAISETSKAFFDKIFKYNVAQSKPTIVLVAGQSGAGKSKVAKLVKEELKNKGGFIHVDADRMRELIPNNRNFPSEQTQNDAGKLVSALRNLATDSHFNIIEEGTFRDSESVRSFINNLKNKGYKVEMVALSVPKEQSLLSIYERYEEQISSNSKNARMVPPSYHEKAFNGFNQTIKELESEFSRVRVINRSGQILFDSDNKNSLSAHEILKENQQLAPAQTNEIIQKFQSVYEQANARKADNNYLIQLSNDLKQINKNKVQNRFSNTLADVRANKPSNGTAEKKSTTLKI